MTVPDTADTFPEDEALFAAIGRMTVSWSFVEAGIDLSVFVTHKALGGDSIRKKRPRALADKVEFLEAAARELDALAPVRDRIGEVCKEVSDATESRHDLIHGVFVEHVERSGEARLVRFLHEHPTPKEKSIKVTTESALASANSARKLAVKMIGIAEQIRDIMLAKLSTSSDQKHSAARAGASSDPSPALLRVELMLGTIYEELQRASLLCEVWWRCAWRDASEDIRSRMSDTAEGLAYGAIEQSLHISLVVSLMTMFDRDSRTASFRNILSTLEQPQLLQEIIDHPRVRKIDVRESLDAARDCVKDTFLQAQVAALKILRDKYIAHREMDPKPHGAKYGFERQVLAAAIGIHGHLEIAIRGNTDEFDSIEQAHKTAADLFWVHAAQPALE